MRKSASLLAAIPVITLYYAGVVAVFLAVLRFFPGVREFLPIGGIADMIDGPAASFEQVMTPGSGGTLIVPNAALRLAIASVGTVALMIPVSWTYFITNRNKEIDASFVHTIVVLPVVVTGVAMVVQNSLALAFSLAGIVAAVRFRFTLDLPSHALYIFTAIAVGLGSGIGALGVALVISASFVYTSLIFWKLDYGHRTDGRFLSLLTRRDTGSDD